MHQQWNDTQILSGVSDKVEMPMITSAHVQHQAGLCYTQPQLVQILCDRILRCTYIHMLHTLQHNTLLA